MISVDNDFETVWGWRIREVSAAWRKHNEAKKLEAYRSQGGDVAGGLSDQVIGRHLGDLQIRGLSAGITPIMSVDSADSHERSSPITSPFPEDLDM